MQGTAKNLVNFMEGADRRYVIPVYQRKYDWKISNCMQLYKDLKRIVEDNRKSHFFGSVVANLVANNGNDEYHIIDGQQRLTTVTLILLAIRNLIQEGKITAQSETLDREVNERYLISPYGKKEIKLRPIQSDRDALERLFKNEDLDLSSNLTINYQFFYEQILREEISVDELYAAIKKLDIILITLDKDDNAQMIFESLNSTGLALTEGDKIRNYVLMGQEPEEQERLYDTYWSAIEEYTEHDVSSFARDYLSVKKQATPTISNVYPVFKDYAENSHMPIEALLKDLKLYAKLYNRFLTCKNGLHNQKLDDCLDRLNRLEIVVIRPFLMEVFKLNQDGKLTVDDVLQIFLITETYLFRRNICDVPTSALTKIFVTLNKEVLRYENNAENYVQKFIYALLSKKESGRFPDDNEFTDKLSEKKVYQMRGKYKEYLFERYENFGTVETKDVYAHLEKNDYSIEHIMPQTMTPAWAEDLGPDALEIHDTWLHRLANLTLTGYNPNLSNKPFAEKRDAEQYGYKNSGIRMNQKIATKASWGLPELEERNAEMVTLAKKIWAYPTTDFVPAEKEYDSCTLDDDTVELTGIDIVKYSYQGVEQPVESWADMYEHVIKYLHQKDKSVLTKLAYDKTSSGFNRYISNNPEDFRSALQIEDNIYIEKHCTTNLKISILRRLFELYGADPMDLVFYLKDPESEKITDAERYELRVRYWQYALPIIQKQNAHRGTFSNCNPGKYNSIQGFFGISGFSVLTIANFDCARVDFYLGKSEKSENKAAFDKLYSHRFEIESNLGIELKWDRQENNKASVISYALSDVSISNEGDWKRMAAFQAEWSDKLCNVFLPYLMTREEYQAYEISSVIRQWALNNDSIHVNINKCNTSYTRFTTDAVSQILPDIPGSKSGWNTENHYFFEIISQPEKKIYIQFVLNAKEITTEQREICDLIQQYYPSKTDNPDWIWRTCFRTSEFEITNISDKDSIFNNLDKCFEEICEFEQNLKNCLYIQ